MATADRTRVPARISLLLASLVAGFLLAVVMPAASPAFADRADDKAAAEVAAARCAKMKADNDVPQQYKENCEKKLAEDLKSGRAKDDSWVDSICGWIPDIPIIGDACKKIVGYFEGAYDEFAQKAEQLRKLGAVLSDPGSALDDFTKDVGEWLKSLLTKVLTGLVDITTPDMTSAGFLKSYAAGAGIAIFVLAFMVARLFFKTTKGELTGEELSESLFQWLPQAMGLVVFGPAIGMLLSQMSSAASGSIAGYFAPDIASFATKVTSMVVITETTGFPGGTLMALALMLLAMVGAASLVLTLLVQMLAMYLSGAIMAVAFVMLIDPDSRQKAMKLPMIWIGLLLARPALILMLGFIAQLADSALSFSAVKDDAFRALVTALAAALALLGVGFAPWMFLKFVPALPGGGGAGTRRSGATSGAIGAAAGSALTTMAYRRYNEGGAGTGGGGSGQQSESPGSADQDGDDHGGGPGVGVGERAMASQRSPGAGEAGPGGTTAAGGPQPATPISAGSPGAGAGSGAAQGGSSAVGGAGGSLAGAGGGGAAGGAGGAAGGAAAGAAGAASGGVLLAGAAAIQLGTAAKERAKETSERTTDPIEE